MNVTRYIRDKKVDSIIKFSIFIVINFFLITLEVQNEVIFVVSSLYLIAWILPLMIDYYKRKHYYHLFEKQLQQLDQKYLIGELMVEPTFLDGEIMFDALSEINHSMLGQVNRYKLAQKEYKEFIELWIHEAKVPLATSKLIIQNNMNKEMKMIDDELNHLNDYLEQALFYARSKYVEKDYIIRNLSLREVVDHVVKRNARLFITKKIKLEMDIQTCFVKSDGKWVEFILQQIIQNALKYSNETTGIIRIWTEELAHCTLLHIEDNGIGIKEKDISRVFEKGFTGDTGRIHQTSTGIGLYLCKMLCDKLYLGIQIDSKETTTVTLTFPQANA